MMASPNGWLLLCVSSAFPMRSLAWLSLLPRHDSYKWNQQKWKQNWNQKWKRDIPFHLLSSSPWKGSARWSSHAKPQECWTTLTIPSDIPSKNPTNDPGGNPSSIPMNLLPIEAPNSLSPSALLQFQKCPQAFYFKYVLRLPSFPVTAALARGTVCHSALERLFDLSPAERTKDNLHNLFRREWKLLRGDDEGQDDDDKVGYSRLFRHANQDSEDKEDSEDKKDKEGIEGIEGSRDLQAEKDWGQQSLQLLSNYMELEDPSTITFPNPLVREMWVHARFPSLQTHNAENYPDNHPDKHPDDKNTPSFLIRGKIDRIDVIPNNQHKKNNNNDSSSSPSAIELQIIDYKTGKIPNFKYSPAANYRITEEQFFQLKIYALLLSNMIHEHNHHNNNNHKNDQNNDQNDTDHHHKQPRLPWDFQQKLNEYHNIKHHPEKDVRFTVNDQWNSNHTSITSLKIIYLTSHENNKHQAEYFEYPITPGTLCETQRKIQSLHSQIMELIDTQDPKAFHHCDWEYCSCHTMRSWFPPGVVHS